MYTILFLNPVNTLCDCATSVSVVKCTNTPANSNGNGSYQKHIRDRINQSSVFLKLSNSTIAAKL